jgi:uncharacterized membrane protein YdjX (TVP38/TMEM64 family)
MKALPYIIAMFAGLFARTLAAAIGGIDYTMDGHDFLMMILAIIAVWSFKGAFLTGRRTRRVHARAKGHSGRAVPQRKQSEDMR